MINKERIKLVRASLAKVEKARKVLKLIIEDWESVRSYNDNEVTIAFDYLIESLEELKF